MKEKKQLSKEEILEKIRYFCAYQERSRLQVQRKLKQLGCSQEDESHMLAMLAEGNYLNEQRFVEQFVRSRSTAKGWGPARISLALFKETGESYREEVKEDTQAIANARKKLVKDLQKKSAELTRKKDPQHREKLIRFCLSRGFDFETAMEAVSEMEN